MKKQTPHLIPQCPKCSKPATAGHDTATGECWTCRFTHHLH